MANSENHCIFVQTSLDTRFTVLVHHDETIFSFKENLCREHKLCFPQVGEITISAFKVERGGLFYHLPDSLILSKAFYGISKKNWFLHVHVLRVEDMVTIMPADQTCPNPHLLEERTEITKDLTLEQVAEQETIKRHMKSLDAKKSQKKSSIDLNQSANASESCAISPDDICTGAIENDIKKNSIVENKQTCDEELVDGVDESHEVCGEDCLKDKPDDFLSKPITKDIERGERIEDSEGSKLVTSAANDLQVAESSSGLTTGLANDKKRKRTKKDHIKQPSDAATKRSRKIVNKEDKVSGSTDGVDATSEFVPNSGGEKLVEAIQQETEMVTRGDALVKKKKSKKAKTLAQEDTLLASAGQNANEDTLVASGAVEVTDN